MTAEVVAYGLNEVDTESVIVGVDAFSPQAFSQGFGKRQRGAITQLTDVFIFEVENDVCHIDRLACAASGMDIGPNRVRKQNRTRCRDRHFQLGPLESGEHTGEHFRVRV